MTAQRFLELLRRPIYTIRLVLYRIYEWQHPDEPWIALGAVKFCAQQIDPNGDALEWGSGRSTIWFARRVKHLISIEHDRSWYEKVRRSMEAASVTNIDYRLIPLEHPIDAPTVPTYDIQPAYVRACNELADQSLNLVVIDGHYRQACVASCLAKLKPGGLLLVDNTDRLSLGEWGVPPDWPIVHQSRNVRTQTTIWRKPNH